MRLFVGTFLEQEQKINIGKMRDALKPHLVAGRAVHADNLHFTWLFLGETAANEIGGINDALKQAAALSAQFDTSFCGVENFSGGTVVASLKNSKSFSEVYGNIFDGTGSYASAPPAKFRPHVTMLRDAHFSMPFSEAKKSVMIFNRPFTVAGFSLIESRVINGRLTYAPLSEFYLKPE